MLAAYPVKCEICGREEIESCPAKYTSETQQTTEVFPTTCDECYRPMPYELRTKSLAEKLEDAVYA